MTVICPRRYLRSLKINTQRALKAIDTLRRILRKSELSIHLYMCTTVQYMHTQARPSEIQTPAHWNFIGRSRTGHRRLSVFAYQYSSATFVSLRFHNRKEKLARFSTNVFFLYCVSLELRKSESVCIYVLNIVYKLSIWILTH